MFGSITAVASFSLLILGRVSALPFAELSKVLPRDVAHVALDEDMNEFVAFKRDGTLYGRYRADAESEDTVARRDAGASCANLSVDEAKSLSGWDTIVQYANDNWGSGSRNIVTNPSQYPSNPAEACVSSSTVKATFSSDPVCQQNTISTGGELTGTSGTVSLSVQQGYTSSSTWTVSTAATIGISSTTTVNVGFPDVADVSEAITVSASVTNTRTDSFTTTYNDVSTVTLMMTAPEGETCTANQSVTSCTVQATGSIQYIATGWVWFNYDDKTNGHYKWAVNIDAVVSKEADRSSYASIKGSVSTSTEAAYQGNCS